MKKRDHFRRHSEHHPKVSFGLFLILLGLALLVATNDLLNLGSVGSYFTWQTAMIFIGTLLILNLQFTGGLLLVAGGTWFFLDHFYDEIPELVKTIYWPSVVVLIGLGFIVSALFNRYSKSNQLNNK